MVDLMRAAGAKPLIDELYLQSLADDLGADGVVEAARIFLEDAPARLPRIHGDAVHVRREAHALAGSARAMGLMRLGEAASAMQDAADEATTADPAAAAQFEMLLLESVAALEAWVAARTVLT